MRLLYQFPTWMQHLYRGVTWRRDAGVSASKTAYLTFDDGPIPEATPAILDILRQYGVKATFFVVGDNILKYPHIYARMRDEGHRIGNHTMHHLKGSRYSLEEYMHDVDACAQAIGCQHGSQLILADTMLFRPPYGKMTCRQKRAILERGYEIVLWDVLTHDYNARYTPQRMMDIVRRYTRPGSIINFHDSVKSYDRTIAVLPQVIEWLIGQGYDIQLL